MSEPFAERVFYLMHRRLHIETPEEERMRRVDAGDHHSYWTDDIVECDADGEPLEAVP